MKIMDNIFITVSTAYLGTSSADYNQDPQRTTNSEGLILSGNSIVTLPKFSSNDT